MVSRDEDRAGVGARKCFTESVKKAEASRTWNELGRIRQASSFGAALSIFTLSQRRKCPGEPEDPAGVVTCWFLPDSSIYFAYISIDNERNTVET